MLPRRGRLGLRLTDGPAPTVRALVEGGAAQRAGLSPGEVIDTPREQLSRCRAGVSITLTVRHGGAARALCVTPDPWPEERYPGLDVRYGELTREGVGLRTILVTPPAPRATVLYAQGVDLASVERAEASDDDPLRAMVLHLARAGHAVMRLERRGVGDSEGDDPGATSWQTERDDLAAALRACPGERVFLLGHSLGAMHAAAVAAGDARVAGVVLYGAGLDPWRVYLDENLRRQLALAREPDAPGVHRAVAALWDRAMAGEDVSELFAAQGDRTRLWSGRDPRGRWHGRTTAYWRAVQREDPAEALRGLGPPALAAWGACDWLSARDEHERIAALTRGAFVEVPRADHGFADFATAQASFDARGRGPWQPAVGEALTRWLDAR